MVRGLSTIEFFALFFTGLAALASALQAYVTYEARGEVTRALIFSEQINACADLLTALDPVVSQASEKKRQQVLDSPLDNAEFFPALHYFPGGTVGEQFQQRHKMLVDDWVRASKTFTIVMPESFAPRIAFFDKIVKEEMTDYSAPKTREEFAEWLRRIDAEAQQLVASCKEVT